MVSRATTLPPIFYLGFLLFKAQINSDYHGESFDSFLVTSYMLQENLKELNCSRFDNDYFLS